MIKTKLGVVEATGPVVVLMADYSCITHALVKSLGKETVKKAFEDGCHGEKNNEADSEDPEMKRLLRFLADIIVEEEASDGTDNGV